MARRARPISPICRRRNGVAVVAARARAFCRRSRLRSRWRLHWPQRHGALWMLLALESAVVAIVRAAPEDAAIAIRRRPRLSALRRTKPLRLQLRR
jgi:hypothetical protein